MLFGWCSRWTLGRCWTMLALAYGVLTRTWLKGILLYYLVGCAVLVVWAAVVSFSCVSVVLTCVMCVGLILSVIRVVSVGLCLVTR